MRQKSKDLFTKETVILNLKQSENLRDCCRKFYQSKDPKNQAKKLSKFCRENNIEYESLLQQKKTKVEKRDFCLYCGKKFEGRERRKRFCSHRCAALYNSKLKKCVFSVEDVYYCKNCGKKIEKTYASKFNFFCDKKCDSEFRKKETIRKWYSGELKMKYDWMLPESIKEYFKERVGNKCERCGWDEKNPVTGRTPLQIHHVDGDCTNNDDSNIEVLCPNCHSLTRNYGSLNKNACKERTEYIEKRRRKRRITKNKPE